MAEFQPITTQEEFDERLKGRLARERERWEKESAANAGVEDLKAELQAKDDEITKLGREHHLGNVRRALRNELLARGVTEEGRIERATKLVDLEAVGARDGGEIDHEDVLAQLDGLAVDIPELVHPRGAGSGGSSRPLIGKDKALTRDEIEGLSPEEMAKPGVMAKIDAFMKGER